MRSGSSICSDRNSLQLLSVMLLAWKRVVERVTLDGRLGKGWVASFQDWARQAKARGSASGVGYAPKPPPSQEVGSAYRVLFGLAELMGVESPALVRKYLFAGTFLIEAPKACFVALPLDSTWWGGVNRFVTRDALLELTSGDSASDGASDAQSPAKRRRPE